MVVAECWNVCHQFYIVLSCKETWWLIWNSFIWKICSAHDVSSVFFYWARKGRFWALLHLAILSICEISCLALILFCFIIFLEHDSCLKLLCTDGIVNSFKDSNVSRSCLFNFPSGWVYQKLGRGMEIAWGRWNYWIVLWKFNAMHCSALNTNSEAEAPQTIRFKLTRPNWCSNLEILWLLKCWCYFPNSDKTGWVKPKVIYWQSYAFSDHISNNGWVIGRVRL